MPINLDKYTQISDNGTIRRYRRQVYTPMPEEGNSGYIRESNTITVYRTGAHLVKVAKITDMGWSVWLYRDSETGTDIEKQLDHGLDAQQAQRLAQRAAMGVAQ